MTHKTNTRDAATYLALYKALEKDGPKIILYPGPWPNQYPGPWPNQQKLTALKLTDELTLDNMEQGFTLLDALSRPTYFKNLEAHASMLLSHPEMGNYDVPSAIMYGLDYYNLRRLTKKQKEYVVNWIFDGIDRLGRNAHERAAMTIDIFSGQRKSYSNYGGEKPYMPTVGATGAALKKIKFAARVFSKFGEYEGQPIDGIPMSVLRDAGVDVTELEHVARVRTAVHFWRCRESLLKFRSDLASILVETKRSYFDMTELVDKVDEHCRKEYEKQQSKRYKQFTSSHNPTHRLYAARPPHTIKSNFAINVGRANSMAAWLRLNTHVSNEDPALEDFVDDVIKRLTTRLKGRAARKF